MNATKAQLALHQSGDKKIRVLDVRHVEYNIETYGVRPYWKSHIKVNGVTLGQLPASENALLKSKKMCGIKIRLSDGTTLNAFERGFTVIYDWKLQKGHWNPLKTGVYCLGNLRKYFPQELAIQSIWLALRGTSPGDVIGQEGPFRWSADNQWLTNGLVAFPRKRPEKAEWRDYPIRSIPAVGWPLFLQALEGKWGTEILQCREQATRRQKKAPSLTPRQRQVQAILSAKMWDGGGATHLAVGSNLIFFTRHACGDLRYVLDNPGIGALYVFSDIEEAKQVASRELSRTEAKCRYQRIIHCDGWEQKLAGILGAPQ
jgi:hypothetical protein